MSVFVHGGMVFDSLGGRFDRLDVLCRDGKITALFPPGSEIEIPDEALEMDATGKLVLPGLVDMHVHLREPGFEHKETIAGGSLAGAAGGFTSLACMPNTKPVNDCAEVTERIKAEGLKADIARIYPIASLSVGQKGEKLTDFASLKAAGAVGVSDDGFPVADSSLMRRALVEAAHSGLLPVSHSEDPYLFRGGVMHEGEVAESLGLPGIPSACEEIMVFREIMLAKLTGCPVHIAHVSTGGSVELLRRAKEENIPVSAETAPHYFTLDHTAVIRYGENAKMNPPLREAGDVAEVKRGLAEGVIDVIATDHAPHTAAEKKAGFLDAPFGITGLQTALPLTLALVTEGVLSFADAIGKLTIGPASLLGIPGGVLAEGGPADLTVVDPEFEYLFDETMVVLRGLNSPFIGMKMKGIVLATVMGGRVVWQRSGPDTGRR